ncbi:MAG: DUF3168 domain-containing protein [Nitrosomonas sp.]|nr:DUF3168 domain-containing protein [Nitrosomonas sp.]
MSAELIIKALLADASVTALVGDRVATPRLPQNTALPAIVYQVIDTVPQPNVAYQIGGQRAQSRIQINPLAGTIAEIKAIHEAIRNVLDFLHAQTVAGHYVISSRLTMLGDVDRDDISGIWTQPADYMLIFIE